ncbi:putative AMP-binding enzyme [Lindgomyces ingoldianus]|uniref:AMP-binding enzyme n=1 Tax=Lindgomyces ingoldianus TaxID=673940 RepID=A0ACB6RAC0_9PLEO|nr:putative AMP-binding enzyme [Lindgomyces ingoldianus]KAF2476219.1 putative AMP-binding enzyme [Lindgomyces ingoldianus]
MPLLAKENIDIPTKDILSWACDNSGFDQNKPIYIDAADPSNSISAAQATTLIRKLVAGFKQAGLENGDTVLIHSFNNIYYPIIVLGIIGFGGVFTGTNPSYTTHELKHAISASKAKCVISEPEILEAITAAAKDVPIPSSRILVLNSTEKEEFDDGQQSWRSLLNHGEEDWHRFDSEEISKDTTAMLLFSSGTTGLPKPAILSHHNLIAQHHIVFEHKPRPYDLSRLIALPMFHAATAPSTHTSALRSGHAQYIMRRFEVNAFMAYAEKYRITDLTLVPPMVTAIVMSPLPPPQKKQHLQHVKAAFAGAAPLDKAMQARFQSLLSPSTPFTQIWAMTETSCFASLFHYPENDDTGSVGLFLPNLDVKLVDEHGTDISSHGVRGELCVRGPTIIRGYMGVDRSQDFDAEGYFRTGDILYCDPQSGKWYIVDRKKELIKVRGFQVAPAELEGVLLDHPNIVDAAVIGIPTPEGDSELPRAYVVKKEGVGKELGEEHVRAHLEERLAKYKRLDGGVKFVDMIPKTPSGKILKRVLREQAKREVGAKL